MCKQRHGSHFPSQIAGDVSKCESRTQKLWLKGQRGLWLWKRWKQLLKMRKVEKTSQTEIIKTTKLKMTPSTDRKMFTKWWVYQYSRHVTPRKIKRSQFRDKCNNRPKHA